MRIQVTALLLLVLWVAACVSAPPERTQYLLRYDTAPAVPAASPASGKLKVGLGSVSVAAYLTQPGLALETAPNQLRLRAESSVGRAARRGAHPLSPGCNRRETRRRGGAADRIGAGLDAARRCLRRATARNDVRQRGPRGQLSDPVRGGRRAAGVPVRTVRPARKRGVRRVGGCRDAARRPTCGGHRGGAQVTAPIHGRCR